MKGSRPHFSIVPGILLAAVAGLLCSCGGRGNLRLVSPLVDTETIVECRQDEQGYLLLDIGNQGKRPSIATTTRIEFPGRPPYLIPTRPVAGRDSTQIRVPVPEGCQDQPCTVSVTLDVRNEVSDEGSTFQFRCRLRPTIPPG